jgi:hypothetical protein
VAVTIENDLLVVMSVRKLWSKKEHCGEESFRRRPTSPTLTERERPHQRMVEAPSCVSRVVKSCGHGAGPGFGG